MAEHDNPNGPCACGAWHNSTDVVGPDGLIYRNAEGKPQDWESKGKLWYVVEEGDWNLSHSKPGDVGFDLPVIVNASKEEYKPKVQPYKSYYIAPKGSEDDPIPYVDIPPLGSAELSTGLRVKVPDDSWGNIKSRSSTGWKKRLDVFEGVIDSGYTGPLFVLVFNPNQIPIRVHEGDRLAQLILMPKYPTKMVVRCSSLPTTIRGATGFGSSGGYSS